MIDYREGKAPAGSVTHTTFIAGSNRIGMYDCQGLGGSGSAGNGRCVSYSGGIDESPSVSTVMAGRA
jgi:hypothetical protein